jgi:CheY-like chemotaxis protein
MKILILEDNHERINEFKKRLDEMNWVSDFVETSLEAIDKLKNEKYGLIFLDHDLGGDVFVNIENKNTGSEVARFINKQKIDTVVIIHSLNTPASKYMQNLIPGSYYIPFVWNKSNWNKTFSGN